MQLEVEQVTITGGRKDTRYVVGTDLNGELTLQELLQVLSNLLVQTTIEVVKDEQSMGFDKNPVMVVDGSRFRPITDVKPFGKIEVYSRIAPEVELLALYDMLIRKSPVYTGDYQNNHAVFYNKKLVATSRVQLATWLQTAQLKDKDAIRFLDTMPYSGKLEREGTVKGKASNIKRVKSRDKRLRAADGAGKVRRPNGVYYTSFVSFKRKFKSNVYVNFQFIPGSELGLTSPVTSSTGQSLRRTFADSKKQRGKAKYKGYYVYPSILLRIREEGIA